MDKLIQEVKQTIETKQLLFQYDKELHLLIGLVERVETAERERDEAKKAIEETIEGLRDVPIEIEKLKCQLSEAVKALELYANDMNWLTSVGGHLNIWHPTEDGTDIAAETLKHIKGAEQAEGHHSTESAQAQAGGRIGGSHE